MSSSGSLIFYGKSGLSEPYFLGYGKTTIGSSNDNDIRIKVDDISSCIMDTNEFGITTFVNENVNENILVNNASPRKYTILENGDILEFGKIKLKYCNPSIDQKHLELTRKTIGKKISDIITKLKLPSSASKPLKRLQKVDSSMRRFSTGSKLMEARITPKFKKNSSFSKNMSSPLSAAKRRVSQRMISRRYSTLASLKENEEFDFDSHDSESPRKRDSILSAAVTPLKNKTFSGNSKFSTPPPSKNNTYSGVITDVSGNVTPSEKEKFSMDNTMVNTNDSAVSKKKASFLSGVMSPLTNKKKCLLENSEYLSPLYSKNNSYSGNMSELSENVTTPENNVTAASITPLNISKKTRNSLNGSSRLSYIDFPNSSTPKSAIKTNRSSMYRPLVEDITPASPSPRSSLRNSSLKKPAFTQRRSVNFDISSASDNSKSHDLDLVPEERSSITGRKRKTPETSTDDAEVLKKIKRTSFHQLDREVHDDSSLSGILNLSDTSGSLSENVSHKLEIGSQSIQSFNEELPNNDISQCLTSSSSSVLSNSKSSGVQTRNKSNLRSKSLNIERTTRKMLKKFSETLDNAMITNLARNESSHESSEMNEILDDSKYKFDGTHSKPKHLGSTRSKSVGCKTRLHVPSTRSRSLIPNKKLSLDDSFKTTKPSIIVTSTNIGSERVRLSTGSIKDSTLDLSDDVFEPSIKLEEGSRKSMRLPRTSSSISSSNFSRTFESDEISDYKTPKSIIASGIEERYPFSSSKMSLESISSVTSNRNSLSFSQNSSCLGDVNLGTNIPVTSESVFKTPKGRTPRKSKTPNNSLKKIKDSTDVFSTEKLFRKSLEDSSKRRTSTTCYDIINKSQSITSLNESYKNTINSSFESSSIHEDHHRSSAKITFEPLRMSSTRKRTPKLPYSPDGDFKNVAGLGKPMKTNKTISSPKDGFTDVSFVEKILATPNMQKSPKNDLTDVGGVMKLFKTPKVNKSPKNDLTSIAGVKKLMKTPKIQKSPKNDLSNVEAVKKLLSTPNIQKSPYNDLTNVGGVKKLLKTPKAPKSPNNDLTNVAGMKKLLRTPKIQKSPNNDLTNINGLKKLLKTPKFQKSPNNDLTNVAGVKKLLKTPRVQKSPKNDLTIVKGVKALMNTPKIQKSPLNDLTKVAGIKKLMSTPKEQKSPKNDLTKIVGVKKLMASPKYQRTPKNDLTDVQGVKNLLRSPKEQKKPKNDLLDVRGIRQLLRTPENKPMEESHDLSGIDILFNETEENDFDKLSGKKPIRTYGKSPKRNEDEVQGDKNESSDKVLKWLEDHSKQQNSVAKTAAKRGKKKFEPKPQTPEENSHSALKQQKLSKEIEPTLDTSSGIIKKPASTPIKRDPCFPVISKVAISDITIQTCEKNTSNSINIKIGEELETKLKRGKRNIENVETIAQPSPKRTRRNEQKKKEAEKNIGNDESSETPVEKKSTRNTRGKKKGDDANKNSSQECFHKEVEKPKDEEAKPQKEEKIIKRTRGKKLNEDNNEEDAKKTVSTRSRRAKNAVNESKENEKSLTLDSQTKSTPEKRSRQKESDQQENVEIVNEPIIKRTRRARNTQKEIVESAATENVSEPTEMKVKGSKRGKNNKTEVEANSKIIERESEPVEEESGGEVEKTVTTRRGRKRKDEKLEDKETSVPTKKEEKNEIFNKDETAGETRSARSKKGTNTKYKEEEWDTPIKIKNKKRQVTFKKSVELLQTPAEKNSTNNTRSLRPRNTKLYQI